MTFGVLPLTDPLVFLQMLAARHWVEACRGSVPRSSRSSMRSSSGRAYCAWAQSGPIDPVTDLAHWVRGRLGLEAKGWRASPTTRLFVLAMILVVSAVTGTVAWELVNPITPPPSALWSSAPPAPASFVVAVFLFDLFVARRGWCSAWCARSAPTGSSAPAHWSRSRPRTAPPATTAWTARGAALCSRTQSVGAWRRIGARGRWGWRCRI